MHHSPRTYHTSHTRTTHHASQTRTTHHASHTTHHTPRITHHIPRITHHTPHTTHHAPRTHICWWSLLDLQSRDKSKSNQMSHHPDHLISRTSEYPSLIFLTTFRKLGNHTSLNSHTTKKANNSPLPPLPPQTDCQILP